MFVDKARVFVKAGKGGDGCVSFRREKYIPSGGPDGGDGGKGGNVILQVDGNMRTLMDFKYKSQYLAKAGEQGRGKKQFGKYGQDLVIRVPSGTLIRDEATGYIIADLIENGQEFIVAKGGKGGKGNVHYKSATRQAPNFAEAGTAPEERWIMLELKLLADVGLVGFPNVGKSTLLSVLTSANPKIANYHFTTITPNLGVVQYFEKSFVIADIPGLIEGAHVGSGLGLDFLKHVERTKLLIHVVDVASVEGRDPVEDIEKINKELEQYSEKLMKKVQVIAANKMDVLSDMETYDVFNAAMEAKGFKVFPVSAATKSGLEELIQYTVGQLDEIGEIEEPLEEVHELVPETREEYRKINVYRENEKFLVQGKHLLKIFNSTNFEDQTSLKYFQDYLKDNGVFDRLREMGIKDGDTVRVFNFEFEYYE